MIATTKILVPNKEWLITNGTEKIGSISKHKRGYWLLKNGRQINFKNLKEINKRLGIELIEDQIKKVTKEEILTSEYSIYEYPCSSRPYEPVYDVKRKLPLFAKSAKSKSRYCAGHYVIKFRKGWVKSFCPKLITLERYPFQGPFKTEQELKNIMNTKP